MISDMPQVSKRFPRAAKYNPDWVLASVSGAANPLWLSEWLAAAMDLRPGMRVLDLGCGRAASSIFLRREFGAQVWATDLWFSASENMQRIRDAGVEDGVFPIHADARSMPFAAEFFDAILCIDSFPYFGTDDLYLNYLAQFVKRGGWVGIAGAGLMQEVEATPPEHLREWWTQDLVPTLSELVASALGSYRHRRRRGWRHYARRLAVLAGLAQGGSSRQPI
jgi:cyclopropane fatty-acyl-phospholipid synthase-like methyltransferase